MQHTLTAPGSSTDPRAAYHGGHLSANIADGLESRLADLLDIAERNRPDWHRQAACLNTDPDLFFDDARKAEGLALCAVCPVRRECGVSGVGETGVWGGIDRDIDHRPPAALDDSLTEAIIAAVAEHPFELSVHQLEERLQRRLRNRVRTLITEGRLVSVPTERPVRIERIRHGRLQAFTVVQTTQKLGLA